MMQLTCVVRGLSLFYAVCRHVLHPDVFALSTAVKWCNDGVCTIPRPPLMQPISVRVGRASLRTLVLTLLFLCAQSASALDLSRLLPTTGSGTVVTETRNVGPFQALKLSTDARVVVRQGDRYSVEVQAEGNVTPLIDTYVENQTLVVEDNKHYKSPNAAVVVTVRHIISIGTTGSVAVVAEGLNVQDLSLSMGGSSAMNLKSVSVGRLHAALGGSSALKASGVAEDFSLELGGSSALQASELEANSISISGGGSAQAVVWAKQSLRISLGGSSGVSYYGNLSPILSTSGAATVKSLGGAPPKQQ